MTRLRRESKTRCVIAIVVAVPALAGCGSAGLSGHAETGKTDARWSVLRNCVMNSASLAFNDEVVNGRTKAIRVYHGNDLVAGITYEATSTNAEEAAKRHQAPAGAAPSQQKTGSWLAISNVAYFFSLRITPAETDRVTACLSKTYRGEPRWPVNVPLSTLSSSDSPYT